LGGKTGNAAHRSYPLALLAILCACAHAPAKTSYTQTGRYPDAGLVCGDQTLSGAHWYAGECEEGCWTTLALHGERVVLTGDNRSAVTGVLTRHGRETLCAAVGLLPPDPPAVRLWAQRNGVLIGPDDDDGGGIELAWDQHRMQVHASDRSADIEPLIRALSVVMEEVADCRTEDGASSEMVVCWAGQSRTPDEPTPRSGL
jgi:hypothetical protein